VFVDIEKDGNKETLEGDYVLVAVGRKPVLTGIDVSVLGLALGKRGEIAVDSQMRTNLPNVYAIGDAVGGKLLAHKAEEEGTIAAEVIAGHKVHMDYKSMPAVVYTHPEIATCGLPEHEVKASGRAYKTGRFPFSANGRARTMAETQGFVKFVSDAETEEILGCHIIGVDAADLLQEVVLAMEFRGSSDDIGITVHPHPTLSEAVKEAALGVSGRSIHI
jgi:dihydrolipoamide dehydrogenase